MISFAFVCASNQNRSMAAHSAFLEKSIFQTNNNNSNPNTTQRTTIIHNNVTFTVKSYGTGSQVKLPGKTLAEPNTYPFGTPYIDMYNDLKKKDERFYVQNGLLPMLKRNAGIKMAPERWHEKDRPFHNIVFTFEDRVFDAVVDSIVGGYGTQLADQSTAGDNSSSSSSSSNSSSNSGSNLNDNISNSITRYCSGPVHVLNLNVKDNHEEAQKNAKIVADLCEEFILHTADMIHNNSSSSNNNNNNNKNSMDSTTDRMNDDNDDQYPQTAMYDDWESAIDPLIRKFEKMYKKRIYHLVLFES